MARKGLFSTSPEKKLTAVNSDDAAAVPQRVSPPAFATRGALGAVTRSIDELAARADAARDLEARLTAGETVIDVDPDIIDPPFIADRLSHDDDADFRTLVAAIEARGQDSPVLVRPHPNESGRYQLAFGRRRWRACKVLGRQVRAVVKKLSDRDLVLAQGQENSARANLSFIERALFAWRLEEGGYDRETIMSALTVDKTVVSRMISVVKKIPLAIIEAIGSAPTTGRDRWVELAAAFEAGVDIEQVTDFLASAAVQAASSDERFDLVFALITNPPAPEEPASRAVAKRTHGQYWSTPAGVRVARVSSTDRAFVLSIDKRNAPGFGDFLLTQMDRLFETYSNEKKED